MRKYKKIFESILDSSVAEDSEALDMFIYLILLCDWQTGIVDMTPEAIARRINHSIDFVKRGLEKLQKSDPDSRSPLMGGKRIVLLEPEHRNWGWLIVNFNYYRNLQSTEDRREYMKEYMKERRNGETKKIPKKIGYSPEFEIWWGLYPARGGVKAGKETAFDQFKKAIQSEGDFQQLLKATERYKSVELPKDGERFLKKNYWRDWIPPTTKEMKPGQPPRFKDSDGLVWEMGEHGWKQVKV